ncbi:MAG: ATP-binding protein [Bacteroidales bacterium]|jgi:predicted AAA+ superfamily ATPase|nr:ATP-binding protein [Bacteroidales bacterium]
MKLIDRPLYINRLKRINGSPDIKIITGIRRCGKSRLLQAFVKYIQSTENDANIIFIDYARLENESLREYHALHQYVLEHHQQGKSNYLMIDEVQMCPNFETAINSLHSSEQFDIYLTGSNAFLLSADLATLFTGRHIEIPVLPFSFKEYCVYHNVPSNDIQTMFDKYVTEGGLSGSYVYTDASDKENYIKEVYSTILTRDLTEKYNLTDAHALIQVANYLMDNIGNITSPNNVSGGLTANSTPTSHVTVRRYIQYLCNAFVFYKVDRYDIRGRKYLESLNKYYLSDTGIRFAMLGKRNMDWGRVYENIVFLELKRRGYEVYVGKLYQKEVDFVIVRGNEKAYVQVSDNIAENTTFEREVSPLLSIKDAYPKLLIARTRHEEYDYQGIKIFDIAHWLTEDYT